MCTYTVVFDKVQFGPLFISGVPAPFAAGDEIGPLEVIHPTASHVERSYFSEVDIHSVLALLYAHTLYSSLAECLLYIGFCVVSFALDISWTTYVGSEAREMTPPHFDGQQRPYFGAVLRKIDPAHLHGSRQFMSGLAPQVFLQRPVDFLKPFTNIRTEIFHQICFEFI